MIFLFILLLNPYFYPTSLTVHNLYYFTSYMYDQLVKPQIKMLITEPKWINHGEDKRRRPAIFSIQIDPTNTRVATGGEDYSIRLWKMQSCIASEETLGSIEENLLSTLRSHSGDFVSLILGI